MRPWGIDQAPANFITPDEGQARLRASYGDQTYRRLVALKNTHDPDNVFGLNANIAPNGPDITDTEAGPPRHLDLDALLRWPG
jgi:hypothetical protein